MSKLYRGPRNCSPPPILPYCFSLYPPPCASLSKPLQLLFSIPDPLYKLQKSWVTSIHTPICSLLVHTLSLTLIPLLSERLQGSTTLHWHLWALLSPGYLLTISLYQLIPAKWCQMILCLTLMSSLLSSGRLTKHTHGANMLYISISQQMNSKLITYIISLRWVLFNFRLLIRIHSKVMIFFSYNCLIRLITTRLQS